MLDFIHFVVQVPHGKARYQNSHAQNRIGNNLVFS